MRYCHIVLLLALAVWPPLLAQQPADTEATAEPAAEEQASPQPPPGMSAQRFELIQVEVASELESTLDALVNRERLAERYGFEYPVQPPQAEIKDVKASVDRKAAMKAREQFPDTKKAEFEAEAQEHFAPVRPGTKITVRYKDDREPYTGHLREINRFHIVVEQRQIHKSELARETLARLDKELSMKMQKAYVDKKMAEWEEARAAHQREIEDEVAREVFNDAGYIKVKGKWVPKKQFFEHLVTQRRDFLRKRLLPKLERKIFHKHGFAMYKGRALASDEVSRRRAEEQREERELEGELDSLLTDEYRQPKDTAAAVAP